MSEQSGSEYREQRLANMKALAALGYPPYGGAFQRSGTLAELRAGFAEGRDVTAAGRLATIRNMGKSVFADLRDGSDRFQIFVQKGTVGDAAFQAFKLLDAGDHIGVAGAMFKTRTGEPTVNVSSWTMLSKALLPLPEKWHGLRDVDARYRQRHLDLIANPSARELFGQRIRIVAEIRRRLCDQGFAEVETPMLQPMAGGAAARPFAAHYHALGTEVYLRIAPELYLKRLLVGGFDKVFELNRCFRNEGIDRTHVPEFTMLEIYQAYGDLSAMKRLIEDLVSHVARTVFGRTDFDWCGHRLSLAPPWAERDYRDLVRERMGADWYDLPAVEARRRAEAAGLAIDPSWDITLISHEVYEKLIEGTLIQPTFVKRLPAALIPLARACADDPGAADVFELVIGGQEIAPAYTEMNNPLEQRERLLAQSGGDASRLDEDFLCALEHGMPPAGGMGVGVDRLVMLMTGAEAIRDVILFPQLKPRKGTD